MLSVVLLLALAFSDSVTCTIQGSVYRTESEPLTFTPGNDCTGLRVTSDDTQIVIYSPYRWVAIKIPMEKGHRRFQYRWGSAVAHLESDTVEITWGDVARG